MYTLCCKQIGSHLNVHYGNDEIGYAGAVSSGISLWMCACVKRKSVVRRAELAVLRPVNATRLSGCWRDDETLTQNVRRLCVALSLILRVLDGYDQADRRESCVTLGFTRSVPMANTQRITCNQHSNYQPVVP